MTVDQKPYKKQEKPHQRVYFFDEYGKNRANILLDLLSSFMEKDMQARVVYCDWSDIAQKDKSLPILIQLWKYIVAVLDFLMTGTFFRFMRISRLFGFYFLLPVSIFFILGLSAMGLSELLKIQGVNNPVNGLIGFGFFFAVLYLLGKQFFLFHLFNLWSFSRNYLYGRRKDLDEKLETFATDIVAKARKNELDEILICGMGTGAALALDVASRALSLERRLGRSQKPVIKIVTLGSSLLKIGLHPATFSFREKLQKIIDANQIEWADWQQTNDIASLPHKNQIEKMRLNFSRSTEQFPTVFDVDGNAQNKEGLWKTYGAALNRSSSFRPEDEAYIYALAEYLADENPIRKVHR